MSQPSKPVPSTAFEAVTTGASVKPTQIGVEAVRRELRSRNQPKGRQPDDEALEQVRALVGEAPYRRDLLVEYLHLLNDAYQGLLERHLVALAKLLTLPMAEVFEVATFYHHFNVLRDGEEAPELTLRVCDGLSCELAGSRTLFAQLQQALRGKPVRLVSAPCVGRCEQAPIAVVHQNPICSANAATVLAALNSGATNHPSASDEGDFAPARWVQQSLPVAPAAHTAPEYVGYDAYCGQGGYRLACAVHSGTATAENCLQTLEEAGLRGLGGAGFAAARKWRIVREQDAPRLLVVNIDEGEPGTFKDRTYLERDPHRFLEGMLVAAQIVGVEACYLYLRDEYHGCRALLQAEIAKLQARPPFRLPLIELRRGAGAYICGEESALIESIEGKRGEPRMRPPYIAQVGLFGRPTLEHNFETLYWVRDLLERGAGWFRGFGRNGRSGLRSFSVSGRVRQPGVKLAPAGITVRELIDEYCGGMLAGHRFYAYLPGGASGGILPAELGNVPLDFDTLQPYGCFIGSAAIVVLSDQDRARDAASNAMRFFADESCGQCTPCRVGTAKAVALMEEPKWDLATFEDLNTVMMDASICGLGQAAPNVVRCVQRYFANEIGANP